MKNTVSRVLVAAAAAGMVFAPISAQANTRAADNAPVYSTSNASQPGLAGQAEGEEVGGGGGAGAIILALLGAAAAIAGIIAVSDDEDDGQSPGT